MSLPFVEMVEGVWPVLLLGFFTAFCGWIWFVRQQGSKSSQSSEEDEEGKDNAVVKEEPLFTSPDCAFQEPIKKWEAEVKQESGYDLLASEKEIIQESNSSLPLHDFSWNNVTSLQEQTVSSPCPAYFGTTNVGGSNASKIRECFPSGEVVSAFIRPTRVSVPESEKPNRCMQVTEDLILPEKRSVHMAEGPFVQQVEMVVSEQPVNECKHPGSEYVDAAVCKDKMERVVNAKSKQDLKPALMQSEAEEKLIKVADTFNTVQQLNTESILSEVKVPVREESRESAVQQEAIENCKGAVEIAEKVPSERKDKVQQDVLELCHDAVEMAQERTISPCSSSLREDYEQEIVAKMVIKPSWKAKLPLEYDLKIWEGPTQDVKNTENSLETTIEQIEFASLGPATVFRDEAETAELSEYDPHNLAVHAQKRELCKISDERVEWLTVECSQEQETAEGMGEQAELLSDGSELPPKVNYLTQESFLSPASQEFPEQFVEFSEQSNECNLPQKSGFVQQESLAKRGEHTTSKYEWLQKEDATDMIKWVMESKMPMKEDSVQPEVAEISEAYERVKQVPGTPEYIAESVKWTASECVQPLQAAYAVPKASEVYEGTSEKVHQAAEILTSERMERISAECELLQNEDFIHVVAAISEDTSQRRKLIAAEGELQQKCVLHQETVERSKGTAETIKLMNWCELPENSLQQVPIKISQATDENAIAEVEEPTTECELCQNSVQETEIGEESAKGVEQMPSECELPQEEMKREAVETSWVTVEKDAEAGMDKRMKWRTTKWELSQNEDLVLPVATAVSDTAERVEQVAEILERAVIVENLAETLHAAERTDWITAAWVKIPKEDFVQQDVAPCSEDATEGVEQVKAEYDLSQGSMQYVAAEVTEPTAESVQLVTKCEVFQEKVYSEVEVSEGTSENVENVSSKTCLSQKQNFVHYAVAETTKDVAERLPQKEKDSVQQETAELLRIAAEVSNRTACELHLNNESLQHTAVDISEHTAERMEQAAEVQECTTESTKWVTTEYKCYQKDSVQHVDRESLEYTDEGLDVVTTESELPQKQYSVLQEAAIISEGAAQSVAKVATECQFQKLDFAQYLDAEISGATEKLEEAAVECELFQKQDYMQQRATVVSEDVCVEDQTTECETFQEEDFQQETEVTSEHIVENVTTKCQAHLQEDLLQQEIAVISECNFVKVEEVTTERELPQEEESVQPETAEFSKDGVRVQNIAESEVSHKDLVQNAAVSAERVKMLTECKLLHEDALQPTAQLSWSTAEVVEKVPEVALTTAERVRRVTTEGVLSKKQDPVSQETVVVSEETVRVEQETTPCELPQEGTRDAPEERNETGEQVSIAYLLPQAEDLMQKTAAISEITAERMEQILECEFPQKLESERETVEISKGASERMKLTAEVAEGTNDKAELTPIECKLPQNLDFTERAASCMDTAQSVEQAAEISRKTGEREELVADNSKDVGGNVGQVTTESLFLQEQSYVKREVKEILDDTAEGVEKPSGTESKLSSPISSESTEFEGLEHSTAECKLQIKDNTVQGARKNYLESVVTGTLAELSSNWNLSHKYASVQQEDATRLYMAPIVKELPECNQPSQEVPVVTSIEISKITDERVKEQFTAECNWPVKDHQMQELIKEKFLQENVTQWEVLEKVWQFSTKSEFSQNESAQSRAEINTHATERVEQLSECKPLRREETMHDSLICGRDEEHVTGENYLARKWDLKNEALAICQDVAERIEALHTKHSSEKLMQKNKELHVEVKKEKLSGGELNRTEIENGDNSGKKAYEMCTKISENSCVVEGLDNFLPSKTSKYTLADHTAFKTVNPIEQEHKHIRVAAACPLTQNVIVNFRVHYITHTDSQLIAVTGSHEILGKWKNYIPLKVDKYSFWSGKVSLPIDTTVEWKFVMVDSGKFRHWEECSNRCLETGLEDQEAHKWWGYH